MNRFKKTHPPKSVAIPIKTIGPLAAARLSAAAANKRAAEREVQLHTREIALICAGNGINFQDLMTGKIGIDNETGNITTADDVKKQLQQQLAQVEAATAEAVNGKPAA